MNASNYVTGWSETKFVDSNTVLPAADIYKFNKKVHLNVSGLKVYTDIFWKIKVCYMTITFEGPSGSQCEFVYLPVEERDREFHLPLKDKENNLLYACGACTPIIYQGN